VDIRQLESLERLHCEHLRDQTFELLRKKASWVIDSVSSKKLVRLVLCHKDEVGVVQVRFGEGRSACKHLEYDDA